MRGSSVVVSALALASAFAIPVRAHHSVSAGFDTQQTIELEGELTAVRWQNPHILLELAVADSAGGTVSWELETLSANGVGRTGITAQMFSLGDRIKVAGNPARRGLDRVWVTNFLLPAGQELVLGGPQRAPRWSERVVRGSETAQTGEGVAADKDLGVFRVWSSGAGSRNTNVEAQAGSSPALTPAGRAEVERRRQEGATPTVGCVPKTMPRIMNQPYPIEFVRRGDAIVLKIEEYDSVRTIHVEPGADSSVGSRTPSALGHSVGRWDGAALTVTTTDVAVGRFDGPGAPLSTEAVFVERFAPSADGASLDYRLTITDPVYLAGPITTEKRWIYVPGTLVLPYDCRQ